MIILKIRYHGGKFPPGSVDIMKTALPLIVECLWPNEYAFEKVEVVDEGYSYYRMEDIIYVVGEPTLGQRFVGEKFYFPTDSSRQYVIEYYAYDQNQRVIDNLANFIDRLTLF